MTALTSLIAWRVAFASIVLLAFFAFVFVAAVLIALSYGAARCSPEYRELRSGEPVDESAESYEASEAVFRDRASGGGM